MTNETRNGFATLFLVNACVMLVGGLFLADTGMEKMMCLFLEIVSGVLFFKIVLDK